MRRKWWSFEGFVEEKKEDLRKRFLATCDHEGGHLLLGADMAPDAVKDVRVDKPKQGKVFEGVTGVDLSKVPSDVLPLVALAGCMAEAKAGIERLYGMRATFSHDWDMTLNLLWHHLGHVHPSKPDELFYVPFSFGLEDGTLTSGSGYVTAADLLPLPNDLLEDDDLLAAALARTARHLDQDCNWPRGRAMANELANNPGRTFSRDEAIRIVKR